jgi:hypothetical protein
VLQLAGSPRSSCIVFRSAWPCAYINAAFAFSRILGSIAAEAYGEVRASCVVSRRSGWRDRRRSGETSGSAATAAASGRLSSRRPVLPAASRVLPASRSRKHSASRWRTGKQSASRRRLFLRRGCPPKGRGVEGSGAFCAPIGGRYLRSAVVP